MSAARPREPLSLAQLAVVEVAMAAVGLAILWLRHAGGRVRIEHGPVAPLVGLAAGLAAGLLVAGVLLRSPLRTSIEEAVEFFRPILSSTASIIVASLLAGAGEELLFRAGFQIWIGLGWASVAFAVAHSGTARMQEGVSFGKLSYLIAAALAGAALGVVFGSIGLLTAIGAHAGFDAGMLLTFARAPRVNPSRES